MLLKKIMGNNKQNISSRKYGQVKLRASRRGIYSCLFALGSLLCLGVLVYLAYRTYGEAPAYVGSLGLVAAINAGLGVYYGIMGFREREKSYMNCKIGIGFNGLLVLFFVFLFVRGIL